MSNKVTTTMNGFRIEDITFKNARRQSEIDNELDQNEVESNGVEAPTSLTPEQVKTFYTAKITEARNYKEKKLYEQTINWIDELLEVKKKLIALENKEVVVNDYGADDIEED